jgi:hypothetical protein
VGHRIPAVDVGGRRCLGYDQLVVVEHSAEYGLKLGVDVLSYPWPMAAPISRRDQALYFNLSSRITKPSNRRFLDHAALLSNPNRSDTVGTMNTSPETVGVATRSGRLISMPMTKLLAAASCSSSTLRISDRSSESLNFFRTTAAGVGEGRVAHEWDVLRSSYGDGFPSALCFVAAVAFWL